MKRRGISPRSAVLLTLATLALYPINTLLRPDTRLWVVIVWASLCAASWGLWKAIRSFRWVNSEIKSKPSLDFSSAHISATNHLVTHLALFFVQFLWLEFGIFLGLSPVQPRGPVTINNVHFTITLLLVEFAMTGLNFFLVIRRVVLVRNVQRIGGD